MLESSISWEKSIVLEVLLELFSDFKTWTELQEICEQSQHKQIFREIVIAVNNLVYGESESIHKSGNSEKKVLSFSILDMKIPLLNQFDKNQPPQIPENYLLLKAWQILTRLIQTCLDSLANQCFDPKGNSHFRRIKESMKSEFPAISCFQLFEPTWGNIARTFLSINSLACLDLEYRHDISLNLVKFTSLLGVLGFDTGVDLILSSLEEISKPSLLLPSQSGSSTSHMMTLVPSSTIPPITSSSSHSPIINAVASSTSATMITAATSAAAATSTSSNINVTHPSSHSQLQYSLGINDMIVSTIVTALSIALDMGELLDNSWYYIFKVMNTVDLLTIYKSRKMPIVTSSNASTSGGVGMGTSGMVITGGSNSPSYTSSPNLTEIDALAMSAQQSTTILEKSMFLNERAFEFFTENLCKLSTEFLLHDKISISKLPAALFLVQKIKQTLLLNMDRFIVEETRAHYRHSHYDHEHDRHTKHKSKNKGKNKNKLDKEDEMNKDQDDHYEKDGDDSDANKDKDDTSISIGGNEASLNNLLNHLRIDLSSNDNVIRELACESISLFCSQYINAIDRNLFQKSINLQMRVLKPLLAIEKESEETLIYPETIKTILESLLKIIQTIGDYIMEGGWSVILEILYHSMVIPKVIYSESERSQQSLSITKLVFSCVENICEAYLPILSLYNISNLIRSLSVLTVQSDDLNIALTAIQVSGI